MKPSRLMLAAICSAAMSANLSADLGPIVITPTRTEQPQNISSATVFVVDRTAIAASGAVTTSELLRGIPGIQINDFYGNGTRTNVSARGFASTANANTLVMVNGRRLNNIDTAAPSLNHIFPKDIERIEVLAGSAGSLYGDQAVGGMINIVTRKPAERSHRVGTRMGSFGYRSLELDSTASINDALAYRFSVETFEADHYRDHNAQRNRNFFGVLAYEEGENRLSVEAQHIDDELELPGALLENEFERDPRQSNPGFANDFYDEVVRTTRIGYERGLGRHKFSIDGTRGVTEADVLQSFRNSPSPGAGFIDRENRSINPRLSGSFDSGVETAYVVGFDFEEAGFDLEIPFQFTGFPPGATTSNSRQENDNFYFQVMPRLTEQLQLTLGARRSRVESDLDYTDLVGVSTRETVTDDITVREFGLAYRVDDATRFTLRLDENFRFAKVDEFSLTEAGTILDTQTGDSIELGMDLVRGDQQVTVSLYQLTLEDEIEFDPSAGPDFGFGPIGANVNLDETRRNGAMISWITQLSQAFALRTDLGYVDAKFRSGIFGGNDISGVAEKMARVRGDWRISDTLDTHVEAHYTGARYAQGDNGNAFGKLDSITVFNAGIGRRHKSVELSLRINNLTDERYAEFVTNNGFGAAYQPSPERNLMLGASYRFE